MGVSTNGIVFWGFPFEEDEQPEAWDLDDSPLDKITMDAPVQVGYYCAGEDPMYYVYVRDSEKTARLGYAIALTSAENPALRQDEYEDHVALLKAFCKEHGIDWEKYEHKLGWWLVSYCG